MTIKINSFRPLLFLSAYIGTLGILGSPRDYMWAAEISSCVNCAVQPSGSAPVLRLPADIVVPSDFEQDTAIVYFDIAAEDDQPGTSVSVWPRSGSSFAIGVTLVRVTAVDAAGNLTQGSFNVTVTDSRPPMLECSRDLLLPPDPGLNGRVVHFNLTVTDNRPGVHVAATPPSGSFFLLGTTPVVCVATDAAGNTATCVFVVTIADREAPVIACPTNLVVAAEPGYCGAIVNFHVTQQDTSLDASVFTVPQSGSLFPIGVNTVTCFASDPSGNVSVRTFTVTVIDTERPLLNLPADIVVDTAPGESGVIVNYEVTASDNCSEVGVGSWPPSGSNFPIGTTTVISQAADASGNTTLGTFTVTVRSQEIQAPVITRIMPSRRVLPLANGRMYPVALRVAALGKSARIVSRRILAVTCSDQADPIGATQALPDWDIRGPLRLWLRAECNSQFNDRIYTIIVECKDARGNVTTGTTIVRVGR